MKQKFQCGKPLAPPPRACLPSAQPLYANEPMTSLPIRGLWLVVCRSSHSRLQPLPPALCALSKVISEPELLVNTGGPRLHSLCLFSVLFLLLFLSRGFLCLIGGWMCSCPGGGCDLSGHWRMDGRREDRDVMLPWPRCWASSSCLTRTNTDSAPLPRLLSLHHSVGPRFFKKNSAFHIYSFYHFLFWILYIFGETAAAGELEFCWTRTEPNRTLKFLCGVPPSCLWAPGPFESSSICSGVSSWSSRVPPGPCPDLSHPSLRLQTTPVPWCPRLRAAPARLMVPARAGSTAPCEGPVLTPGSRDRLPSITTSWRVASSSSKVRRSGSVFGFSFLERRE